MRSPTHRKLTALTRAARGRKRASTPLQVEVLETRQLMAADVRSYDGSGNNLSHPEWGKSGIALIRSAPAAYADGISAPGGASLASPRTISNLVAAQGPDDAFNDRDLSAFVYAWGQFLDHDLDFTGVSRTGETFPVAIPAGDPYFDPMGTGSKSIPLTRSAAALGSGLSASQPRQQVNEISAFIDASQVYGSDRQRADALRTFRGGKLKSSAGNLLPYNLMRLPNDGQGAPERFFVAGDARANENIELTAMHTLFMREHNRIADRYARLNPSWSDEELYQAARRWVGAEMQVITYNEFLPAILGSQRMGNYRGYNPNINPGITNEFATAAFRFGHSMIGQDIEFLNNEGLPVSEALPLRSSFFAPSVVAEEGIDTIMKYLASDRSQEIDSMVIDDLRNFLFGPPGAGGLDLAALNIQRGRDHGLASYNATRVAYGLRPVRTFAEITSNVNLQNALKNAYGTVDRVELWVGGLAENHMVGASVGPLFGKILQTQFQKLRDGDRFWYERKFTGAELTELRGMTLSKIIQANTGTKNLQANVFEFRNEIGGRVVVDGNRNGRLEANEKGMAGIVVELRDANQVVIQTARTDSQGYYRFKGLDLGAYRITPVVPTGSELTSVGSRDVTFTRGEVVERIDFGVWVAPKRKAGR